MIDSTFPRRQQRARRRWIATRETDRCHQHRLDFAYGAQHHLDAPLASTVDVESII
jgi:hypothetical protein